jgi:23S rRNA (uracil1939-C5)-methyltransferase
VLIGFHERKSRYVADMQVCPVLPQHVSDLLMPLRDLIASMDAKETIPQLEIAVGDAVVAMVVRHMEAIEFTNDMDKLRAFAHQAHFCAMVAATQGLGHGAPHGRKFSE